MTPYFQEATPWPPRAEGLETFLKEKAIKRMIVVMTKIMERIALRARSRPTEGPIEVNPFSSVGNLPERDSAFERF